MVIKNTPRNRHKLSYNIKCIDVDFNLRKITCYTNDRYRTLVFQNYTSMGAFLDNVRSNFKRTVVTDKTYYSHVYHILYKESWYA